MVTITDVARAAQVSKKTVSRVINDHPDVAEATRQRVQAVIDALGYQPSMLARGLVQGRTYTVGVIIDESAEDVFAYPLYSENLRGISRVLSRHNFDMLVHFARRDTPYTDLYRQRRVDGMILMSMPVDNPFLSVVLGSDIPYVLTQRVNDNGVPARWVDVDFEGGAARALEHLWALGHRQFAFLISPPNKTYARLLLRGYRRALADHGQEIREDLTVRSQPYVRASKAVVTALLERPDPPTAFACSDDMMAIQLIQLLQELGYQVPGDLSVVGSDDALIAGLASPPLTTIRQDAYRKGTLAAEMLLEQLGGRANSLPSRQILLPTELVVRGSTGPVRST
ncbi:MAG: LacI family transcriptional regulator [Anaerolineae bacterium]|nr:LacI family transcriptional regulator [Anaerolineae bacterium]